MQETWRVKWTYLRTAVYNISINIHHTAVYVSDNFQSWILLPAPDSDATTVPAKTLEARRLAAKDCEIAKETEEQQAEQQAEAATPNPSSKPNLKREVQSQEMLAEAPPQKTKRLRRMDAHDPMGPGTEEVQPKQQTVHAPPAATAVKAKAAPPVKVPKQESQESHGPQAKAVAECLARSSTADMETANTQETKDVTAKKLKVACDPPPPPDPDDHGSNGSDSEDSDEFKRKEKILKVKKEAHARYMRFHRSLSSTLVQLSGGGILVNMETGFCQLPLPIIILIIC